MSQFRLVALLLLVAAAGCYRDAPPSTLPEPHYFAGPPGGSMDPGSSYSQYPGEPAYEETDERADDDALPPSQTGPIAAAPANPEPAFDPEDAAPAPGSYEGDYVAGAPAEAPPGDPTAGVSDGEIETTLDGYGQWIETGDYGPVWRPDATVVGVDFTPYETGGSWAYTDAGWGFSSEYSWGWLPFHYGRWAWFNDYWGWVPGYQWSPAWVEWRHGGGVVGWRPLRPQIRDHRHNRSHRFGSGALVRDHRRSRQHDAHWRFAAASDLGRPRIRSHLYGNLAEGLRVTSTVKAPPVRARATVRPADLMRNRFSAGGRATQPGRFGEPQVRDHRSAAPVDAYQRSGRVRPTRSEPYGPPARVDRPDAYRPSTRAQPYDSPRNYQPPIRSAPPARMHQPPARTYQPPARSAPPARTYAPPARTYSPPAPPARTYSPPARTYSPPARTYSPPARTYSPSAPPARTYSPSAPPARTYTPSAPPARSAPASSSSSRSNDSGRSSSSGSSSRGSHGGRHR